VKRPEFVFCVHCNKHVAHKVNMCYNNPRGINFKGGRAAQVSRVSVSDETGSHALHDQDTKVKPTGHSGVWRLIRTPCMIMVSPFISNQTVLRLGIL